MSKITVTVDMVKAAIQKFHTEFGVAPPSSSLDASSYLDLPAETFTWNALNARLRRDESSLSKLATELGLEKAPKADKPVKAPKAAKAPKAPKPVKEPKAAKEPKVKKASQADEPAPAPGAPDRPLDGRIVLTFKTEQEWERLRRLLGIPEETVPADDVTSWDVVFSAEEIDGFQQ